MIRLESRILLLTFTLLTLSGCGGDAVPTAQTPHWDRDSCERCRMVLSDRKFAAQIHYIPEGKQRGRVAWFDDIGCAALWLQDKPFKTAASTLIWVNDHRNGEWIDARSAHYLKVTNTPMDYGLGAQSDPAPGALDFNAAVQHIQEVERRAGLHSSHLLDRYREQSQLRESQRAAALTPIASGVGHE